VMIELSLSDCPSCNAPLGGFGPSGFVLVDRLSDGARVQVPLCSHCRFQLTAKSGYREATAIFGLVVGAVKRADESGFVP